MERPDEMDGGAGENKRQRVAKRKRMSGEKWATRYIAHLQQNRIPNNGGKEEGTRFAGYNEC